MPSVRRISGEWGRRNGLVFFSIPMADGSVGRPKARAAPTCAILVAANLTLGFLSSGDNQANPSQFSNGSCSSYATPPPEVQAAQLIQ